MFAKVSLETEMIYENSINQKDFLRLATRNTLQRLLTVFYRENLLGELYNDSTALETRLHFRLNQREIILRGGHLKSLKRLCLTDQFCLTWVAENEAAETPIIRAEELIRLIASEHGSNHWAWDQFLVEVKNSQMNETASLQHRPTWIKRLQGENSSAEINWIELSSRFDALELWLFLEQWSCVGHPYHPCSKTRLGLSAAENKLYAPEFAAEVALSWVAIHKTCWQSVSSAKVHQIEPMFAHQKSAWENAIKTLGLDPEHYSPVPVHPWQKQHVLPFKFTALIETQNLLLLSGLTLPCRPSLSFRTMLLEDASCPQLKLPVTIQATSVERTVSAESIEIGITFSQLLWDILERETEIKNALLPLADLAGGYVTGIEAPDDQRHLSFLLRANPLTYLPKSARVIPLTALFVPLPDGTPLLKALFVQANIDDEVGILNYFQVYCRQLLIACLDLYLVYGIALESHQQNTLIQVENHRITRIIMRDFGGIRIHTPTLTGIEHRLPLHLKSSLFTTDQHTVRKKLIHACLESNLGEWVIHLNQYFGISEASLWFLVRREIEHRFTALAPRLPESFINQEKTQLLETPWPLKCLASMRLQESPRSNKSQMRGDIYTEIENPLCLNRGVTC